MTMVIIIIQHTPLGRGWSARSPRSEFSQKRFPSRWC